MNIQFRHSFYLLIASLIWGFAFVVQSMANANMGPFMFTFFRNAVAVLALLPFALKSKSHNENKKLLLIAGTFSGIALGVASSLQQWGLIYTTAGKSGFITVLYIIMVPIVGLFFKRKCSKYVWFAVVLSLIGVYLLCVKEKFTINRGDIITFFAAIAFTAQILIISKYAKHINVLKYAVIQMIFAGLTGLIIALVIGESIHIDMIRNSWQQLLYMGVMSSGVAYTLQILGESKMNPTVASLIMSLESCIAAVFGWLILGQVMDGKEILGCIVMLTAIILAQLKQN